MSWAGFALVTCVAGACRGAPIDAAEWSGVLLAVEPVEQESADTCGLAALHALVGYHSLELSEPEHARLACLARERRGLSAQELRDALVPLGLEVHVFAGAFEGSPIALVAQLEAGRPVLVLCSPGDGELHYVLVTGWDPTRGLVALLDPRRGRVAIERARFETWWEAAGRLTLLATPQAFPRSDPDGTGTLP